MSLEINYDNNTTCFIKGKFTREYINDIIPSADNFVKNINDLSIDSIHFDLSEVECCDSSALALMLLWHLNSKKNKKKIIFKSLPNDIKDIIKVSNVSELILTD